MEWRNWIRDRLLATQAVLDAFPATLNPVNQIFASGSMEGRVTGKPFVVVRIGDDIPGPYPGAWRTTATLWAHDEPGSYLRIGNLLRATRLGLVGSVPNLMGGGGIACQWLGNSGDLSDETQGTIVRYATFGLNGKDPDT